MKFIKKSFFSTFTILSLHLFLVSPSLSEPHAPPFCPPGKERSSSGELKPLLISHLGFTLAVPEEYEIWREDDGTVRIIHREKKRVYECQREGGRIKYGSGEHGITVEYTRYDRIDSYLEDQYSETAMPQYRSFQFLGKDGFIIPIIGDMFASYFLPVEQGAIIITDYCDCEGSLQRLNRLLNESEDFN